MSFDEVKPKCQHEGGMRIMYDGAEVSACKYQDIETHYDCMVIVSRCMNCGNIVVRWVKGAE